MATKFLRHVNDFSLVDEKALNVHDKLPPGNYVIRKDPNTGALYLIMSDPFTHPKKMYGTTMLTANRILETFKTRPRGTGVLLSGEKGSGKTLLARTVCIEAAARDGIPTIIINAAWQGDQFFTFLSSITQPCIVLFDEFEKVYDTKKNEQDAILTLLDGVFPSKKLFLLTCNDRSGINTNMINRPGRIFYSLEFRGLDTDFIREYAQDTLIDKSHVESITRITTMFAEFNFDMLQALVEEMNRYGETPAEALKILNVSPVHDYADYRTNVMLANGLAVIPEHTHPYNVRSPLSNKNGMRFNVYCNDPEKKKKSDNLLEFNPVFFPADVISASDDGLVLKNAAGDILTLSRQKFASYNWADSADMVTKAEIPVTKAVDAGDPSLYIFEDDDEDVNPAAAYMNER